MWGKWMLVKLSWLVEKTVSGLRIINTLLGKKGEKYCLFHLTTKSTKEKRHLYTTQLVFNINQLFVQTRSHLPISHVQR